jgi:hypothetical protein
MLLFYHARVTGPRKVILKPWIHNTASLEAGVYYVYKGDRFTGPDLKGRTCTAIRRVDGKCIRGKNGNMLVEFNGKKVVVLARHLRKVNIVGLVDVPSTT